MTRSIILLLLPVFLATGCSSTRQFGDATITRRRECAFPETCWVTYDLFRLPRIELGQAREYRFQVRDLKEPTYPEHFYLEVPEVEASPWKHDQSWRSGVLSIELLDIKGNLFFSKRISFNHNTNNNGLRGSSPKNWRIEFDAVPFETSASLLTSYDVVVRIECPLPGKSYWGYFSRDKWVH